jgi:DNA-binding MarR family transcriptional regulator
VTNASFPDHLEPGRPTAFDRPQRAGVALAPVDVAKADGGPADSDLIPALVQVAQIAQTYLQTKALTAHGLTWNEYQVLRVVAAYPKIRSSQAASRLGMNRATLSGVVSRLVHRDLVRRLGPEDRLRVELVLTPQGSDLWSLVSDAVTDQERAFLRKPAAHRALLALSRRIGWTTSREPVQRL